MEKAVFLDEKSSDEASQCQEIRSLSFSFLYLPFSPSSHKLPQYLVHSLRVLEIPRLHARRVQLRKLGIRSCALETFGILFLRSFSSSRSSFGRLKLLVVPILGQVYFENFRIALKPKCIHGPQHIFAIDAFPLLVQHVVGCLTRYERYELGNAFLNASFGFFGKFGMRRKCQFHHSCNWVRTILTC